VKGKTHPHAITTRNIKTNQGYWCFLIWFMGIKSIYTVDVKQKALADPVDTHGKGINTRQKFKKIYTESMAFVYRSTRRFAQAFF
jgi:hypothetical protein